MEDNKELSAEMKPPTDARQLPATKQNCQVPRRMSDHNIWLVQLQKTKFKDFSRTNNSFQGQRFFQ